MQRHVERLVQLGVVQDRPVEEPRDQDQVSRAGDGRVLGRRPASGRARSPAGCSRASVLPGRERCRAILAARGRRRAPAPGRPPRPRRRSSRRALRRPPRTRAARRCPGPRAAPGEAPPRPRPESASVCAAVEPITDRTSRLVATVSVCGRPPPNVARTSTRSPGCTASGGISVVTTKARRPGGTSAATGPVRGDASRVRVIASPSASAATSTRPAACASSATAPGGANSSGSSRTSSESCVSVTPRPRSRAATTTGTGAPNSGRAASTRST